MQRVIRSMGRVVGLVLGTGPASSSTTAVDSLC